MTTFLMLSHLQSGSAVRLGVKPLSSEGHSCSRDAASDVRLSDREALKGEQKAKRETE